MLRQSGMISLNEKHFIMPTVSTTLLQSSSGQKYRTTNVHFLNSSTVSVSNAPKGTVDANRLLLLKDGIGLLTAGGGPSGAVGCCEAGDVAGARRLTLSGDLLSLGRGSLGGCGL